MNQQGIKYLENINERLKPYKNEWQYPQRYQIVERVMRLGREVKAYDLHEDEYEEFALATLKEDFINNLL